MGFYYFSDFSLLPLGVAYGLLALIYWTIVVGTRGNSKRRLILGVLGVVFLLLPVSEEFWIAWNFGQACKQAGTFVEKKVVVDGFFDETRSTHAGAPTRQAEISFDKSGYQFLEMKGSNGRVVHLEKSGGRWSATVLDHPKARYHFQYSDPMSGTPWAHKIVRSGSVVIDSESKKEIARYTSFGRAPAWFYIGLGTPGFACDAPGRWPFTKGSRLIYPEVLIPVAKR